MWWGGNAWEWRSHTFFMFYFEVSWKLFQNGYFFAAFPHIFCLRYIAGGITRNIKNPDAPRITRIVYVATERQY